MTVPQETRLRTISLLERLVLLVVVVALCASLVIAGLSLSTRSYLYDSQAELQCAAALQSKFMVAVNEVLEAPVVGSPERDAALVRMRRISKRLGDLQGACP